MWTVVYIANNIQLADKIKQTLIDEGILVKIKKNENQHKHSSIEILVTASEVEDANEIINNCILG